MRKGILALVCIMLVGCQYDPHANLYTTTEPKNEDIVGTYVLDRFDLPKDIAIVPLEVEVELRADGTFTATNIPPWKLEEPDKSFFASLISGTGKWEKGTLGTLDPGQKRIWESTYAHLTIAFILPISQETTPHTV